MKKIFLFSVGILISCLSISQNFQWAKKPAPQTGKYISMMGIANDMQGNSYVVGYFTGSATFGTTIISAPSAATSVFLAKYDPQGNTNWVKQFSSSTIMSNTGHSDVYVDNNNFVYISGILAGNCTFGSTVLTSSSPSAYAYVAKLDTAGNVKWAKQTFNSSSCSIEGRGVVSDASGNVYFTGVFDCEMAINTTTLTTTGGPIDDDIFLAKYDSIGQFQWVQQAGGTDDDAVFDICIDASNNVYLAGGFSTTASFGSHTISTYGGSYQDIFIAKYNTAGVAQFAVHAGGNDGEYARGIASDAAGNIYITGFVNCSSSLNATFGSLNYTASGLNSEIFLAKYSSSGTALWVRAAGSSTGGDNGLEIAVDNTSGVYICGVFVGSATFGSTVVTSVGNPYREGFVAGYDTAGVFKWVSQIANTGTYDQTNGVCVDNNGNAYAIGSLDRGTATFGSIVLSDTLGGSYITKINNSLSGIKELNNTNLLIYPNPSNGQINIKSSNNIDEIIITNLLGQIIYQTKPTEKNISLQISKVGIYFITLTANKQITTQKVIVSN